MPRNVCVSCQMDAKDKACSRLKLRLQALLAARLRLVTDSPERLRKVREKPVLLVVFTTRQEQIRIHVKYNYQKLNVRHDYHKIECNAQPTRRGARSLQRTKRTD